MIDTVALLLADRAPALRYRALVEVDGAPEHDAEVAALRAELAGAREAAEALAMPTPDLRLLSFSLCRLAYLGLGRGDAAVDERAERLFSAQRKDGSWTLPKAPGQSTEEGWYEGYEWVPLQTALPLRGLAAAGYATDPRAERAYDWLLNHRLDDGSWPTGRRSGHAGFVAGYRRLPGAEGCRSNTTAAVTCFAHHPERRTSEEARAALDHLLRRETRDEWALGHEVARLLGAEAPRGFMTFFARFDLALLLDVASRLGASADDDRVADLIAFLERQRGQHGLWDHPSHPHLSRWLTLDLLASMRRIETGDWAGSDRRVAFAAYPKRRQRH